MKFIIYAPPYNPASGGTIVLHKLCDELNKENIDCKIFPLEYYKIQKNPIKILKSITRKIIQKNITLKKSPAKSQGTLNFLWHTIYNSIDIHSRTY